MNKKLSIILVVFTLLIIGATATAQNSIRYASSVVNYSTNYGGGWATSEILGEPNIFPKYGDIQGNWAFASADDGSQFITVGFSDPIQISSLAIWESSGTGAIDSIFISNPNSGEWELVYAATPTNAGGFARKLVVNFELTEFVVDSVKFTVQTSITSQWEEYDAVAVANYNLLNGADRVLLSQRFEYGDFITNWKSVQNTDSNHWTLKADEYSANNTSTVISIVNSDGVFGYDNSVDAAAYFYVDIDFPSDMSKFSIEFDWNGLGESGYDYLTVHLTDTTNTPTLESEFLSDQIGENEYGMAYSTKHAFIIFGDELSGTTKRLIFKWRNDSSVGSIPISVDNIKVTAYDGNPLTGEMIVDQNGWYANLSEALTRVYTNGISSGGFEIKLSYGTYYGAADMTYSIPGISSENPLTISSLYGLNSVILRNRGIYDNPESGTTIRRSTQNYLLRLLDQQYVTVRGLTFDSNNSEVTSSNHYSRSIYIGNSNNITIENNAFYGAYETEFPDPYYSAAITLDLDDDGAKGVEEYGENGGGEPAAVKLKKSVQKANRISQVQASNFNILISDNSFENVGGAVFGERHLDYIVITEKMRHSSFTQKTNIDPVIDFEALIGEGIDFSYNDIFNSSTGFYLSKSNNVSVSNNTFANDTEQQSAVKLLSVDNNLFIQSNRITGDYQKAIEVYSHFSEAQDGGVIANNIIHGDFVNEALTVYDSPEMNVLFNTILTGSLTDTVAASIFDTKSFYGNVIQTDSSKTVRFNNVTTIDYNDFYQTFESSKPLLSVDGVQYFSLSDYQNILQNGQIHNINLNYVSLNGLNEEYQFTTPNESFDVPSNILVLADYFGSQRNSEFTKLGAISPDQTVPVELSAFTAKSNNGKIVLNWSTVSESNNSGWEIEVSSPQSAVGNQQEKSNGSSVTLSEVEGFTKIGFVSGKGTTTELQSYQFQVESSKYQTPSLQFRLKQIDLDGKFSYSNILTVDLTPNHFGLSQNYPNPFNPVTVINYQVSAVSDVRLVVFDLLGREVATLVNEKKEAGNYRVNFDGSHLTSGVYFYKISAGNFSEIKKMMLVK